MQFIGEAIRHRLAVHQVGQGPAGNAVDAREAPARPAIIVRHHARTEGQHVENIAVLHRQGLDRGRVLDIGKSWIDTVDNRRHVVYRDLSRHAGGTQFRTDFSSLRNAQRKHADPLGKSLCSDRDFVICRIQVGKGEETVGL